MKTYITFLSALLITLSLTSQRSVSLGLAHALTSQSETCYDISISTDESTDISLAGQNYRFFYDAEELRFKADQVVSYLNPSAYSTPEIEHVVKGGIGFLSISINSFQDNDYTASVGYESTSTLSICFAGESKKDQDLIWADPNETNAFASAEIVITEWNKAGYQDALEVEEFNENTPLREIETSSEISVYPNPTDGMLQYSFKNTLAESSHLVIQDVLGRSQAQKIIPQGSASGSIDISDLPDGIYYLKFHNTASIQVIKSK